MSITALPAYFVYSASRRSLNGEPVENDRYNEYAMTTAKVCHYGAYGIYLNFIVQTKPFKGMDSFLKSPLIATDRVIEEEYLSKGKVFSAFDGTFDPKAGEVKIAVVNICLPPHAVCSGIFQGIGELCKTYFPQMEPKSSTVVIHHGNNQRYFGKILYPQVDEVPLLILPSEEVGSEDEEELPVDIEELGLSEELLKGKELTPLLIPDDKLSFPGVNDFAYLNTDGDNTYLNTDDAITFLNSDDDDEETTV